MRARRFLWLLIVPSLLFVILIWFDVFPWLRGPTEWRWNLRLPDQPAVYVLLPIAGLVLYVCVCVRWLSTFEAAPTRSRWRSTEWRLLLFLTLAAPLIQILLAGAVWRSPLFEFFSATTSPSVTGFYSVAVTTPNLPSQLTHYTTLLPLLILVVSGVVRGEVSRLWSYFGPVLTLIALTPDLNDAAWLSRSRHIAVTIGFVGLQLIAMNTRWQPYPSFMNEPPIQPANFSEPKSEFTSRASFGQQIAMTGYTITRARDTLDLEIDWQALVQPPHDYTVFVHVLDSRGRLIAQEDNMPLQNQLPTACWQPGEFWRDTYALSLPEHHQGGYSIQVGLYRTDTGQRLGLDGGTGTYLLLARS